MMRRKHAVLLVAVLLAIAAGFGALRYFNPPQIWPLDDHAFAMIIPPDQTAEEAIRRAREACAPVQGFCMAVGWADRDSAPRDMREWYDPAKIDSTIMGYNFNHNSHPAEETVSFSCRRFPATPRQSCLENAASSHQVVPIRLSPAAR